MRLLRELYLNKRFFALFGAVLLCLISGYIYSPLLIAGQTFLALSLGLIGIDLFLLSKTKDIFAVERKVPQVLSLGDENPVHLIIKNNSDQTFKIRVIDELPYQLQNRTLSFDIELKAGNIKQIDYQIRPLVRGVYQFSDIHLFVVSKLTFFERRISLPLENKVAVYPSILQMKKLQLMAVSNQQDGLKKLRRIGHNYEFDHIKAYVQGDDYRSINWKMTGKRHVLMVNQYEDEKSQQIYSIIDNSRVMRVPFNGLSLLDYSINTSLALSNTAIAKSDKAGLVTFSNRMGTFVKAESVQGQMKKILEKLYSEKESEMEANYETLYTFLRNKIQTRSLVFLYTNFESKYSLERVLPILRKINKRHLLVVVFFENSELAEYSKKETETLEEVYNTTIAEKLIYDKKQVENTIKQHGIQTIHTLPEKLSVNTINKYLELKSRGMI